MVENTIYAALPSLLRAAGTYNSDVVLEGAKGIRVFLDYTVFAAGGTLDCKVQVYDRVAQQYHDLPGASFTQKVAAGRQELTVYPSITAVANRAVAQALSQDVRVVCTVAVNDVTFSLAIETLP